MNRIPRLIVPLLLAAMIIGALMARGLAQDNSKAKVPSSGRVAEEWRFPGALDAGLSNHPTNPTLQLEEYVVRQPFGEAWEFYSQRCGYETPYRADEAHQIHGKNREGGLYIIHDRLLNVRRWTYFAYNTDRYTVAVTIIPITEDQEATSIAVTVGVP